MQAENVSVEALRTVTEVIDSNADDISTKEVALVAGFTSRLLEQDVVDEEVRLSNNNLATFWFNKLATFLLVN